MSGPTARLNLGVGAYRTEELKPYVLDVVKQAERLMLEAGPGSVGIFLHTL